MALGIWPAESDVAAWVAGVSVVVGGTVAVVVVAAVDWEVEGKLTAVVVETELPLTAEGPLPAPPPRPVRSASRSNDPPSGTRRTPRLVSILLVCAITLLASRRAFQPVKLASISTRNRVLCDVVLGDLHVVDTITEVSEVIGMALYPAYKWRVKTGRYGLVMKPPSFVRYLRGSSHNSRNVPSGNASWPHL